MWPIVLHHGLFGYDQVRLGKLKWAYFQGIDVALREAGFPVIVTRVHPTGSVSRRAEELKINVQKQLASLGFAHNQTCIIVGHSMGGLDARYMIHSLGMDKQAIALLTITTPHRGSPYADWCVRHIGQRLGGLELMGNLGLDVQAFSDLTTERCAAFNERICDVPGVKYYSISAARPWNKVAPWVLHSHRIITDVEGENDGLVSVKSAAWGKHLGTWAADHFHTINKRFVLEFRNRTGNIAPYYVRTVKQIVEELKAERQLS